MREYPIPKIVSIGFAVPEQAYTQREVFNSLKYPHQFWPVWSGAQIEKRHFWVPMDRPLTWQEACEEYERGAVYLTKKAVSACLDDRGTDMIGSVSFASCTGYECPSIAHRVADDLKFPEGVFYTSILGMGCEGGFPALKRAHDYTVVTGQRSLAVSCEVCSVCHFPEDGEKPDTTREYELLRSNAIFGDGASAVLIGYDDDPRHPYLIDFETAFDPKNMEHLGFLWQDGRLRVLLSRQVPKIVPAMAKPVVTRLLARNNLLTDDITWWVLHPGGKAVLDNVRDAIGLPEEKMALSREILKNYGNCSSASIGLIGKRLMSEQIRSGEWGVIVSVGAGLAAGATLIRFP